MRAARLAAALCLLTAAPAAAQAQPEIRLLGASDVRPPSEAFGGISGADYDRETGAWLLIADDRSDAAPARVYVARLGYDSQGVQGLRILRQIALRQANGSTYPASASPTGERIDAEALRIDPHSEEILFATEGDAPRDISPAIRRIDREGVWRGVLPTPIQFGFDPTGANGLRPNLNLEGLSVSPNGRFLWLATEAPLIQDGPVSTAVEGGLVRISRLDRRGRLRSQYAYRLDPIRKPGFGRSDNGLSEILALDARRLLVLERSGAEDSEGHFAFDCRLYLVDLRGAADVSRRHSLADERIVRPLRKRLLVDFTRLAGVRQTNLEAMGWGAPLATGERALVLFSDNNFAPGELTQVVVLAVR